MRIEAGHDLLTSAFPVHQKRVSELFGHRDLDSERILLLRRRTAEVFRPDPEDDPFGKALCRGLMQLDVEPLRLQSRRSVLTHDRGVNEVHRRTPDEPGDELIRRMIIGFLR